MTQPLAAGARYRHTNVIAHDWRRLVAFYEQVFGCIPVPPERDQHGAWLEAASGVPNAHLRGMHLRLPGGGSDGPTLEIYSYAEMVPQSLPVPNRTGFGHLAFAVDDVSQALAALMASGGTALGDIVTQPVPGVGTLTFTYARDPEGNILELQSWQTD